MNKIIAVFRGLLSRLNSIVIKLLMVTVNALLILSLALTFVATVTLEKSIQNREKESLKNTAYALKNAYYILTGGDFTRLEAYVNEHLDNGEADVTGSATANSPDGVSSATSNVVNAINLMNTFNAETDVTVSLFWHDERILTTIKDNEGNHILGTRMSGEANKAVLSEGKDYFSHKVIIQDQGYYAFYAPIKEGQKVLGAVEVAIDSRVPNKIVHDIRFNLIIIESCITLLAIAASLIIVRKMVAGIIRAAASLYELAEGDLTVEVSEKLLKQKDEIGMLTRSTQHLKDKLKTIVLQLNRSIGLLGRTANDLDSGTEKTRQAINDVTQAMAEISDGAMSQAADTYKANENIIHVGQQINHISQAVNNLKDKAGDISNASEEARDIVTKLEASANNTMSAVDNITRQTEITNEAAEKIRKALLVITDIAKRTKLLSLNSSIEAARAGEHGRGFGIVAGEIKALAEQSEVSVKEIAEIINNLLTESVKSLQAARTVKGSIQDQMIKLDNTRQQFDIVMNGVMESKVSIDNIYDKALVLDNSRSELVGTIESLSAISEEYAASTEETSASAEELKETINNLAAQASELRKMADEIEVTLSVFNV
jgi:methyl-accepting chemotaxis protein